MKKQTQNKMKTGMKIKSLTLVALAAFAFTFSAFATEPNVEAKKSIGVSAYKIINQQAIQVYFENSLAGKVTVKILDSEGNVVHKEMVKDMQKYGRKFNLRDLNSGTYIIEVSNEDSLTRKVVKI